MLFNSLPFLAFALIFFLVKPLVWPHQTMKWLWIFSMSLLFYAWWDWRFLFLLIGTGSIDYFCALLMLRTSKHTIRKVFLYISVISNLLSISIFKYSSWLAGLINTYFEGIISLRIPEFSLVVPVGISFYTFNSLSYIIDLYRGKSCAARNWLHFMSFISFFPHLVAGPIIRANDVLKQLERNSKINVLQVYNGLKTCIWGLFQKMVIADNLAVMVNDTFAHLKDGHNYLQLWMCMVAFAFQIYYDFNGYSTVARGLAKLCGIHFRLNFNHPYKAGSFHEFWKRWHISLSAFFRDYVYIPLGGNRTGRLRSIVNRWVTMLLSGLWHGANLTFVLWGAIHALFLSVESFFRKYKLPDKHLIIWIKRFVFIILLLLSWVFFRSENIHDAGVVLFGMFDFSEKPDFISILKNNVSVWIAVSLLAEFCYTWVKKISRNQIVYWLLTAAMLTSIVYLRGPEQDFIYFQF